MSPDSEQPPPPTPAPPPPVRKRRRQRWFATAVIVLVGAFGGLYFPVLRPWAIERSHAEDAQALIARYAELAFGDAERLASLFDDGCLEGNGREPADLFDEIMVEGEDSVALGVVSTDADDRAGTIVLEAVGPAGERVGGARIVVTTVYTDSEWRLCSWERN